jgi:hypothetical protein
MPMAMQNGKELFSFGDGLRGRGQWHVVLLDFKAEVIGVVGRRASGQRKQRWDW